MTNYENRIRIGSKLKLGDGDVYEITDIYFAIEENSGQCQAYVAFKNDDNVVTTLALFMVLEMLQMGTFYKPESKMSEEYYERIVKPRRQNLFKIN